MEPTLGLGFTNINQIKTKADVVKYAVEFTADVDTTDGYCNKKVTPNYEKAQALIDFFNRNVSLPETDTSLNEVVCLIKELLLSLRNESDERQKECNE